MWQNRPLLFRTHLLAVAFVTAGRLLYADDPPASSNGDKIVPVTVGGKTVPIRVQDQANPYKDISSSTSSPDGKYNPESINFSATSSMADKKFSFPSGALSKSDPDFKNSDQSTFITKSYTQNPSSPTVPNLDTKAAFSTTSAYSKNASGFDRKYLTSNADAGQNQTALIASATSTDQNRTALLGGRTTDIFASPLADKTFQGSEADAAKRHLTRLKNGQISIGDLPNRPLTIDEVRDFINHGFEPNTAVKPAEPSKALNDPDYKPKPLRDTPQPDASSPTGDDDKNDPIPPPGTMAAPQAPENSELLPQP